MDIAERKPKYIVGDIVTIKKLEEGGYRFGTNSEMREAHGKSFRIKGFEVAVASPGIIPDDGYKYILEGIPWSWASSMFEDSQSKVPTCVTDCPSDKSIDAFIKRNKCPELDFHI